MNAKLRIRGWKILVIDIIVILLVVSLLILFLINNQQFIEVAAFIVSLLTLYLTILRPIFLQPIFITYPDWDLSRSSNNGKDTSSWFLRLRIQNIGSLPAFHSVGRLIAVHKSDHTHIRKFDPLNLLWARQQAKMQPIDIQGNGDFYFLDIAQFIEGDKGVEIRLRVDVNGIGLPEGEEESPGSAPTLLGGIYYFKIAVYCENANIDPFYLSITPATWQTSNIEQPPFLVEIKDKLRG